MTEPRGSSSGREAIENGLRHIGSLLKGARGLPGRARLTLEQAARSGGGGGGGGGTAGGSGSGGGPGAAATGSATAVQQQLPPLASPPKPSAQQRLSTASSQNEAASGAAAAGTAGGGGGGAAAAAAGGGGGGTTGPPDLTQLRLSGSAAASADEDGSSASGAAAVPQSRAASSVRVRRFQRLLSEPLADVDALRELAWSGVPAELRPDVWRLLLGYAPPNKSRRAAALARRRREYADMVSSLYDVPDAQRGEDELAALRQVAVDAPRTAPGVALFHAPAVQESLRRMLYIWGMRHPASGYVQGMNDLATPFLAVFLAEGVAAAAAAAGGGGSGSGNAAAGLAALDALQQQQQQQQQGDSVNGNEQQQQQQQPPQLDDALLLVAEADAYWCLSRLLEGIQDHYTPAQPGIQRAVFRVRELVGKNNARVVAHLDAEGVDFLQFAFRWVNCLLLREVPFGASLRLWDTYLSEGGGGVAGGGGAGAGRLADFLVYVCAAFLAAWERDVVSREFGDLLMFLQRLPTADWGEPEVESVLSSAFVLRNTYSGGGVG